MTRGRTQLARSLVVAQTRLFFFEGSENAVKRFIETGRLSDEPDVIPYDAELLKAIVNTGKVA